MDSNHHRVNLQSTALPVRAIVAKFNMHIEIRVGFPTHRLPYVMASLYLPSCCQAVVINNTTGKKPYQALPHLRIKICTWIGADTMESNLDLTVYKTVALPIKLYQQYRAGRI